jgi:cyclopropane fatty-acyl-phospholipid synthase-like methyltransferase
MAMHYGYWDKDTRNLRQSLTNMNVKLAELAGISKDDYVLDAGCGVGGSSIFLAKNIGCKVKGITLSAKQVEAATLNAINNGISGKATFEINNYSSTNYPDESFDVVWAIESVCHAAEKADFLREAHRILKKGGRLIMADFFSNSMNHSKDKNNMLNLWAATWAIPEFENIKIFEEKAAREGFKNIEIHDATKNITPSAFRLHLAFYPGIVVDTFLRLIGQRNRLQKANVWSTYYQYHSLKKGLWSYQIIKGFKGANYEL